MIRQVTTLRQTFGSHGLAAITKPMIETFRLTRDRHTKAHRRRTPRWKLSGQRDSPSPPTFNGRHRWPP
jgi:hypothetical protein